MKKISALLASLPLITTACGGGDSSSGGSTTPAQSFDLSTYKGTYSNNQIQSVTTSSGGTFNFDASTTLITSDKQLAILTSDYKAFFLDPDTNRGKYFRAFTFIDFVNFTISESSSALTVSFRNADGDINGSLSFSNTNDYTTASNSIGLAGTWIDDASDDYFYPNHGSAWTFTMLADGSFTATTTGSSCSIDSGLLTPIDNTANEYSVTMSVSECAEFSGTHTGIAYVETNNTPNARLVLITNNGSNLSSRTLGIKPVKQ